MWFDKNSRLRKAIRHGNSSDILSLIQKGADINHKSFGDYRPLDIAVRTGQLKILNLLIQKGAIVNTDDPCDTPLQYAETSDVIRALLETGIDMYSQHYTLVTVALTTLGKGNDKLLKFLDTGVNVNARNIEGETPLIALAHKACQKYFVPHQFYFSKQHRIALAHKYKKAVVSSSQTKLQIEVDELVESCFRWKIKLFIDYGADINAISTNGHTALIWSALWNTCQITQTLLNAGADPNLKNTDGITAIQLAAAKGHEQIVKILLKAGAIA